jgi:drug/metabolite transporter (DMT)-like permease
MPTAALTTPSRAPVWVGLLILYVVWGSTYLGIAIAVDTIPPFLMAASRFLLAGVILLVWSIARGGRAFSFPTQREWRDSAIVGALLLGGGMGMVAYGEQTVPSGITALFIAMMPVWVAVLGRIFLRERLPRLAVAGILLGFVGVAILIGPSALGGSGALEPLGLAAILISPIAWSAGSLFASHRAVLPGHPLVATGAQMVTGGLVLVAMSLVSGELRGFRIEAISTDSAIAMVYLTLIGSLLAFTAYGWLLRVAPLPLIATYAYVNPVVAVLLGALVLSEPIEPRTLLAGAVIVVGVAVIVSARGRMAGPRAQPVAANHADGAVAPSVQSPRPSVDPTTG